MVYIYSSLFFDQIKDCWTSDIVKMILKLVADLFSINLILWRKDIKTNHIQCGRNRTGFRVKEKPLILLGFKVLFSDQIYFCNIHVIPCNVKEVLLSILSPGPEHVWSEFICPSPLPYAFSLL